MFIKDEEMNELLKTLASLRLAVATLTRMVEEIEHRSRARKPAPTKRTDFNPDDTTGDTR